ncbi:hypothetical protein HZS_2132, partial [Henneguya salminicola]
KLLSSLKRLRVEEDLFKLVSEKSKISLKEREPKLACTNIIHPYCFIIRSYGTNCIHIICIRKTKT